jgi:hypothetical protein
MFKQLEKWANGQKGRYVKIDLEPSYGATCWNVELGNVDIEPKEGWAIPSDSQFACVLVSEAQFLLSENEGHPENVVFVMAQDTNQWPGLEKVLQVALDKVQEFGL